MPERDVLIVGAGPAGLACAAALGDRGISSVVLEQADQVAAAWRKHYDRLHLHTDKRHSALPGLPMPKDFPKYPARDQVVEYLESYVEHHAITVEFGERVTELREDVARLTAREEADAAYQGLVTAERAIEIAEEAAAVAMEDLRVVRERYSVGAATILDVLVSQSAADQANTNRVTTRYDYLLARAELEAVLGREL